MKSPSLFQELRTGFVPTFWIANTLELFERLAFYGAKAVLVVYLADKVGFKQEAGTLAGARISRHMPSTCTVSTNG